MRKISLNMMLLLSVVFSGCTEDTLPQESVHDSIAVSSDELHFGPDGGSTSITVTSSDAWRLSGGDAWVTASVSEGNSGDNITFDVQRNTSESERITVFKVFTGSAVKEITVMSESGYYLIPQFEETARTFSHNGINYEMKIKTNIPELEFKYSDGGDSWIHFGGRSDLFGITTLTFNISENTQYVERTSSISISGQGSETAIDIRQLPTYVLIPENESYMFDNLAENTFTMNVRSNADFKTANVSGWITVSEPVAVSGPDETGLASYTIEVHLQEAKTTRIGNISFVAEGSTLCSVIVRQNNPDMTTAVIPDQALGDYLVQQGWVLKIDGNMYEVVEKGLTATELELNWSTGGPMTISSLELFPMLQKLNIVKAPSVKTLDLSKCPVLSELTVREMQKIEHIEFGDSPLTSFVYGVSDKSTALLQSSSPLVISGNNITDIDLSNTHYNIDLGYDKCSIIDVTGCTALKNLNVKRGSGNFGVTLKTIRMTAEQASSVNIVKHDATEIEIAE